MLSLAGDKTVPGVPFETPRCPTGAYACSDPPYSHQMTEAWVVQYMF